MAAETIAQDDIPTRPEDQAMGLRPRTAPSSGTVLSSPSSRPPLPAIPINVEPASPPTSPPPRPARPESGVIRDINAWLDASMATASPPLMSSVPYWRAAQTLGVRDSPQAQHAIPIPTAANIARPATSHSHSALCLRRHAKRLHIPIPLTLHSTSPRYQESMQGHRTSRSMPLLVMPSEHVSPEHTTSPPHPNGFLRPNDAMRNTSESSEQCASFPSPAFPEHAPSRLDTPTSGRTGTMEVASERRRNGLFLRPARSAESTRPSTAAAGVHREDSFGDISDAPTYCSGLPPPSYRSRAPSILSTSSFGCIDAMAHAQREISRQQVAQRRGMRDRLKDFARTPAIK